MAARDPVAEAARAGAPDRYLAALYAPEPARARLIALAAFEAETARVAATVRDPLLAEIRLQWWRDALEAAAKGTASGHPVVDALLPGITAGLLPMGLLLGMVDAAAPTSGASAGDLQALKSHLNKREAAAFLLAAWACLGGPPGALDEAARRGGYAYGLARLLAEPVVTPGEAVGHTWSHSWASALNAEARAAQIALCRAAIADAAPEIGRLDTAVLPAFLPLAMTLNYLSRAKDGSGRGITPLRRWWCLWRAATTGRIL